MTIALNKPKVSILKTANKMKKEEIRTKVVKIIVDQMKTPTKSYVGLDLPDNQELTETPLLFGSWNLEFMRTDLEETFGINIEERYGYEHWFTVSDVVNYICERLK